MDGCVPHTSLMLMKVRKGSQTSWRLSDLLELELLMTVSLHVGVRN